MFIDALAPLANAVADVFYRLVNDRETGKPKGFGFCEYGDAETAQSAIRNLNNVDFHGRNLRVDYADDDKATIGGQAAKARVQPKKVSSCVLMDLPRFTFVFAATWCRCHFAGHR